VPWTNATPALTAVCAGTDRCAEKIHGKMCGICQKTAFATKNSGLQESEQVAARDLVVGRKKHETHELNGPHDDHEDLTPAVTDDIT